MTRFRGLAPLLLAVTSSLIVAAAAQQSSHYVVSGMVLKVDRVRNSFTASIQAIPGYMPAMTMPFEVPQRRISTVWYLARPWSLRWSSTSARRTSNAFVFCGTRAWSRIP